MMKANLHKAQEEHNNTCTDLERLRKAIRTGSTARGTTPTTRQIQSLDLWDRGTQWEAKVKNQAKEGKYPGLFDAGYKQTYGGAGNIAKGLLYIQGYMKKTVDRGMDIDAIYQLVVDQQAEILKNTPPARQDIEHTPDLIRQMIHEAGKKQANENVKLTCLRSILDGYLSICANSSLTEKTDRIIEWLILIDLSSLLMQFINPAQDTAQEKQMLIYRSCVDLLSTGIALRLKNNPDVLSNSSAGNDNDQNNIIVPSKLIVAKNGQDALVQGLSVLGYSIDTKEKGNLPGFKLKTVLSTGKETDKKDIAVYFLVGHIRRKTKFATAADPVACVGRISETRFEISQKDLQQLTIDVTAWCADSKKTLCVDLTITKPRDELLAWMRSPDIQKLVQEEKLNILVWQSEQKQHSLGTGKFSAGSSYLLTADSEKLAAFNTAAGEAASKAPDHNLSTFFRDYCEEAKHAIINQQKESARVIAEWFNQCKCLGGTAIANGPFVNVVFYDENTKIKKALQHFPVEIADNIVEASKIPDVCTIFKSALAILKTLKAANIIIDADKIPKVVDVINIIKQLDENIFSNIHTIRNVINVFETFKTIDADRAEKAFDALKARFIVRQHTLQSLRKIWPDSPSFGFDQTTTSSRDEESIRISVGLNLQKEEALESALANAFSSGSEDSSNTALLLHILRMTSALNQKLKHQQYFADKLENEKNKYISIPSTPKDRHLNQWVLAAIKAVLDVSNNYTNHPQYACYMLDTCDFTNAAIKILINNDSPSACRNDALMAKELCAAGARHFKHRHFTQRLLIDAFLLLSVVGILVQLSRKLSGESFFFSNAKTARQKQFEQHIFGSIAAEPMHKNTT